MSTRKIRSCIHFCELDKTKTELSNNDTICKYECKSVKHMSTCLIVIARSLKIIFIACRLQPLAIYIFVS